MKRTALFFKTSVIVSLLIAGSAAVFAQPQQDVQSPRREFQRPQRGLQSPPRREDSRHSQREFQRPFEFSFHGMRHGFRPPEINPPRINSRAADMSVYEQFGLSYDREKRGFFYNGKLVGLFVDRQGRGITYLSRNGEIHVKVVRGDNGNLSALTELPSDEYNEITARIDSFKADITGRMERWREEMGSRRPERSNK